MIPARDADAMTILHNRKAGEIVRTIVKPTLEAGGTPGDCLVLLESVAVGVILATAQPGNEQALIDALMQGIEMRVHELKLGNRPVQART